MKELKEKVSITLDGDIVREIRRLAEEDERSFSQYINLVLRTHIRSEQSGQVHFNSSSPQP